MRVPSAAPVRAFSFFASVAVIAAAACTSPGRGDGSGTAGQTGTGGSATGGNAGGAVAGSGGSGVAGASGAAGTGAGPAAPSVAGADRRRPAPAARRAAAAARPAAAAVHPAARALRPEPAAAPPARPRARAAAPAAPPGPRPPSSSPAPGTAYRPSGANVADARAAYAKWKTDLLTSDGAVGFLRVRRPNSSGAEVNSTVSEGIAYGMLLSVYADDQPTFDKLWQYSQNCARRQRPDELVHQRRRDAGAGHRRRQRRRRGHGLRADRRRRALGRQGQPDDELHRSRQDADRQDLAVRGRPHAQRRAEAGDRASTGRSSTSRTSRPLTTSVFGRVTGQTANWNNVAKTSYDVIEKTLNAQNGNASNGLVPAWSTPAGMPMAPPGTSMPTHHQLDSCRTPFRIAVDYCWNAEPRALTYLQKITGFYAGVGAANIVDGYDLNGTPHPSSSQRAARAPLRSTAPAGVGAMATGRDVRDAAQRGLRGRRDADAARGQHLLPGVVDRADAADDDRPVRPYPH